jgi:hypothetical protein
MSTTARFHFFIVTRKGFAADAVHITKEKGAPFVLVRRVVRRLKYRG